MVHRQTVLVVDDEPLMRITVQDALLTEGYEVLAVETGAEGKEHLHSRQIDVVLTDLRLPDMDGVEIVKEAKTINPAIQTIVITAYGSIESAVAAMKQGAQDYLTKPFAMDELLIAVRRLVHIRELEEENRSLRRRMEREFGLEGMVGTTPQMLKVYDLIETVARTDATVLIMGESGTGKELAANAIHLHSLRKDGPFIKVNCAALPETLLESELFGHERGAFTGAVRQKKGRFELADRGTLFLDEIGDIPLTVQVKLLRVLQERRFERVGGTATIGVDVRLVCATQRDLREEVRKGTFREDLFYRLNVVPVTLPPLRERRDDILPLAEHFVEKFRQKMGKNVLGMSAEAKALLLRYRFPGNIRELENMLERAAALVKGPLIEAADLPEEVCGRSGPVSEICQKIQASRPLSQAVDLFEKEYIQRVLQMTNGRKAEAASILGISRKTLWEKIRDLAINGPDSV